MCFDHYPTFGRNVGGKRENDTREDYVRNLALAGGVAWEAGIPLWYASELTSIPTSPLCAPRPVAIGLPCLMPVHTG